MACEAAGPARGHEDNGTFGDGDGRGGLEEVGGTHRRAREREREGV